MGVEHVSTFSDYVACEQSKPRENACPLALASSFACCSRVTSRDPPTWIALSQGYSTIQLKNMATPHFPPFGSNKCILVPRTSWRPEYEEALGTRMNGDSSLSPKT